MKTHVALLRGINVGGRAQLPMKSLAAILESLGADKVKTYLQTGNVSFQSAAATNPGFTKTLAAAINAAHGFEPYILILDLNAITDAMANNPFPEAKADPKSLHLGFLATVPQHPDLKELESLKAPSERFRLIGSVFYLHAPEGVGRSKLAAAAEKLLGVSMTSRNWNTVCKIRDMASQ